MEKVNNYHRLIYFPLLCDGVVLPTHKQFYTPDDERKEDVHPPPPYLRRVIEDWELPVSEDIAGGENVTPVTYEGDVNKQ
jgi:hypothetical protein